MKLEKALQQGIGRGITAAGNTKHHVILLATIVGPACQARYATTCVSVPMGTLVSSYLVPFQFRCMLPPASAQAV